jgi:hypothetical protein
MFETSRVYVRCSRTQSMRADVRSAVPRTATTTKNLISVGRADGASRREYAPQKPDRLHTHACVALRMAISEACSPTLSMLVEGGMGMAVCNAFESVRTCCNQKQPYLLRICTRAEGGEWTVTVAVRATIIASQKLTPSVTSVNS